jgi:inositol-pentakisphosphate 2-kinase
MPESTQHRTSSTCPASLTKASLHLDYLAEGAANVIYSVSVVTPSTLIEHSNCCVMRLRKDLSFTKPCKEVIADFENSISPLFSHDPSLLLEHSLYNLTPELVSTLNKDLHEMDGVDLSSLSADDVRAHGKNIRHHHRRHVYLPSYEDEQYGILMQNLQGPGIDWLVEFKPKWLLQSPSAPADALNCRTCALNAMRRKAGKVQGRGDSGICPMDLLSQDDDDRVLQNALARIWPVEDGIDKVVAAFRQKVQPALQHLITLQQKFNTVGVEHFKNPDANEFGVAMALRDCSVFLALRRSPSVDDPDQQRVEISDVKFADLDLKSAEGGKVQKWAAMEQDLLDGGWYYHVVEGSECALSRGRRS